MSVNQTVQQTKTTIGCTPTLFEHYETMVSDYVAEVINGQRRIKCDDGTTDVVTEKTVWVVKHIESYMLAVARVKGYAKLLNRSPVLYLFYLETWELNLRKEKIDLICASDQVTVLYKHIQFGEFLPIVRRPSVREQYGIVSVNITASDTVRTIKYEGARWICLQDLLKCMNSTFGMVMKETDYSNKMIFKIENVETNFVSQVATHTLIHRCKTNKVKLIGDALLKKLVFNDT